MRARWLHLLIMAGLLMGAPAAALPQAAASRTASFLSGPPLTFEQVLEAVRRVRQGVLPESRLRQALQKRGVDFALAPEDLEKLKAARPTQGLLDLVVSLAKPLPPTEPAPPPVVSPPEPPKPKLGTLQLACEPPECSVLVNGKPAGQTQRGQLTVKDIPAGQTSINVQKEGFHVAELKANIEDGRITPLTAELEPMKETMRMWGQRLFARVVAALGGESGLGYWRSLQGAGTLTLVNRQGQSTRWAFQIRLLLPDLAAVRLTTATRNFEATLVKSQFAFTKGMPDADEIEHTLALLRDYQLGAVVKRMQEAASSLETRTLTPKSGQELSFLAESSVERWKVTLQADDLPRQIEMTSAAGVNVGLTATYADYQKTGSTVIPRAMVLRLPGESGQGAEVRFDGLEAGPPFSEDDIRRKRKLFGR